MEFNVVLDIVLGLVVLFWVVATASSFVVEAVHSIFGTRATGLEAFVGEMLDGKLVAPSVLQRASQIWLVRLIGWLGQPVARLWRRFVNAPPAAPFVPAPAAARPPGPLTSADLALTTHPLIQRLYKPQARLGSGNTAPSYIPADLFVKALLDRLNQLLGTLQLPGALLTQAAAKPGLDPNLLAALTGRLGAASTQPDARDVAQDLASFLGLLPTAAQQGELLKLANANPGPLAVLLREVEGLSHSVDWPVLQRTPDALYARLEAALRVAPGIATRPLGLVELRKMLDSGQVPAALADALRPLLDAANHDIEMLRKGIEGWYEAVMDRAGGWFRRRAQVMLLIVALLLAGAFNLDSLYIGQRLAADPALRADVVQVAEQVKNSQGPQDGLLRSLAFKNAFDDIDWESSVAQEPAAAAALAMRAQPLLVSRGALVGPMLTLQAAAVDARRRCGEPPHSVCAADWRDAQQASLQQVVEVVCAARLAKRPDPEAAAGKACEVDAAWVRPEPNEPPNAHLERLWNKAEISWSKELAKSAAALRFAVALEPGASPTQAAAKAFLDDLKEALEQARKDSASLDSALSRLPLVGSAQRAWVHWQGDGGAGQLQPKLVWLSLLGWFITGFMASLGAPMWFDLLNRLTQRRISGPKPTAHPVSES